MTNQEFLERFHNFSPKDGARKISAAVIAATKVVKPVQSFKVPPPKQCPAKRLDGRIPASCKPTFVPVRIPTRPKLYTGRKREKSLADICPDICGTAAVDASKNAPK